MTEFVFGPINRIPEIQFEFVLDARKWRSNS